MSSNEKTHSEIDPSEVYPPIRYAGGEEFKMLENEISKGQRAVRHLQPRSISQVSARQVAAIRSKS